MIPDVIGLPLDDARERLAAAGIDVGDIVETRPEALRDRPRVEGPTPPSDRPQAEGATAPPPARKHGGLRVAELAGALRVIRVRGEGPVALVVTRERYLPQPPAP